MSDRIKYSSGVIWEDVVGYSRAVKVGNRIIISGTTSIEEGKITGENNPYEQTKCIIRKLEKVLIQGGSKMEDIVRLRVYVTDISRWEEVGKALGETFSKIKPAQTLVGISALVDPTMMVEIEAEAVIS